jgi:hypothetical protein
MDINRNNYEEYFLLYVDNELTDSEKTEVLLFVKENKDLEEEFRMIHHTVSRPDPDVKLGDKVFLIREKEGSLVNRNNYEEIFVLYHDNELTETERQETEEFLFRHPELKNEFDLLRIARLTPEDSVVFPGRKLLYRKEKPGKVIPVIFWRMIAAAVFTGAGLWVTYMYVEKPGKKSVAVQSTTKKSTAPEIVNNIPQAKKSANTLRDSVSRKADGSRDIGLQGKLEKVLNKNAKNSTVVTNSGKVHMAGYERLPVVPTKIDNQSTVKINNEVATGDQKIKAADEIKDNTKAEITSGQVIQPSKELAKNDNIQPANYAVSPSEFSDANDNGQNYVFYDITSEEFRKTKVGGFLKKVKRIIARNNPISRLLSGDEKQVVSN